ncbi:hypothetical protein VP01_7079g1 [Puccinia sorghi]|uniref:Reverse transcriptase Ty1/copia-type domain-containing protein n=1 Tax=Puccinia sorghi TaxID=27349 RepID=A0A0L6UDM0_9BASI|nr:hypothetical protein VP01_7079g1 [Puccinia sorghi]
MDLTYDSDHVTLSQKKLIEKGLVLAGILECCPVNTLMSVGIQLNEATPQEQAEFERLKINYRTHTGILNYLSCRTRPDLAPAVSILSSFNNSPGINHWKQVIHCWKYLAGTIDLKLTLRPDSKAVQYVSGSLVPSHGTARKSATSPCRQLQSNSMLSQMVFKRISGSNI